MTELEAIFAQLRQIVSRLDSLDNTPAVALKRAEAAKAMSMSRRKLEQLIAAGKIRTADDAHLVPMSEVRRYCAPKLKRKRAPAIGHRARAKHVDGQGEEAIAEMKRAVRAR